MIRNKEGQIGEAKDLFTLVNDRLPPGRADLFEVKFYLTMVS